MAGSCYVVERGLIVAANGTILFADDVGATWDYREAHEGASEAEIVAVEFYSPVRLYAITEDGRVLMSMSNVVTGTEARGPCRARI